MFIRGIYCIRSTMLTRPVCSRLYERARQALWCPVHSCTGLAPLLILCLFSSYIPPKYELIQKSQSCSKSQISQYVKSSFIWKSKYLHEHLGPLRYTSRVYSEVSDKYFYHFLADFSDSFPAFIYNILHSLCFCGIFSLLVFSCFMNVAF